MVEKLCRAILGVLLPPLAMFLERGCGGDFWINLILTILLWFPGVFHFFHVMGVECVKNILCLLIPPVGVFLDRGCAVEFWLSLILTILLWVPGMIYSYYLLM